MALKIQKALFDQLRQHGEETYPHECCGVLVGEFDEAGNKTVKTRVACGNTRTDSPENRYHINPAELIRIQREAALAGQDIVGFYHSHPDCRGEWSQHRSGRSALDGMFVRDYQRRKQEGRS